MEVKMMADKETSNAKKPYSTPNAEIVMFSRNDVITASGEVGVKWSWADIFDNPFEDE